MAPIGLVHGCWIGKIWMGDCGSRSSHKGNTWFEFVSYCISQDQNLVDIIIDQSWKTLEYFTEWLF